MIKPTLPWHKIPGWFDYKELYEEAVRSAKDGYHFIEIGCHQGRSTAFMALEILRSGKKIKLDACDIWTDSWDQVFLNNMAKVGVKKIITPVHMASAEAAKNYNDYSLDFIFIDADHSYKAVLQDLECWYSKLKSDRFIAGHDFKHSHYPGVEKAVEEFFCGKAEQYGSCWRFYKP